MGLSREQELAMLREKLASREGRTGLAENVAEIKRRIAELEAQGD